MKNTITKYTTLAPIIFSAFIAAPSFAKDTYWGVDAGLYQIDLGFTFDVINIQGVYGWNTSYAPLGSEPLSAELRGSFNVDDDGIELTYTAGAYLKQGFSLNSPIKPYVIAGIAHAKADAGGLGTDTETGLSFGIGALYELPSGRTLSFEYMPQLVDDVSGFNIGLRF